METVTLDRKDASLRPEATDNRRHLRPGASPPLQLACIITSFNYEAYVGDAIRSVLDQLDERCELIVVDNASADKSWDVIQSFGIEKAYRLERNRGQVAACHFAFQKTQAPFVMFLDSDDALAPFALSRILALLEDGVSKIQYPLTPIDAGGNVIGPAFPRLNEGRERQSLMKAVETTGFYVTPPTSGNVLCRDLCELMAEVDYEQAADGVSMLAAPFFGEVISLSAPLALYRVHDRNASQIGMRPSVAMIDHFSRNFYDRLQHLSRVAEARNLPFRLMRQSDYLYCLKQEFIRDLLLERRPKFDVLLALLVRLAKADRSLTARAAECGYFFVLWTLPQSRAMALLDYRSSRSGRSLAGLVKSLFAGGRGQLEARAR